MLGLRVFRELRFKKSFSIYSLTTSLILLLLVIVRVREVSAAAIEAPTARENDAELAQLPYDPLLDNDYTNPTPEYDYYDDTVYTNTRTRPATMWCISETSWVTLTDDQEMETENTRGDDQAFTSEPDVTALD
ncbi:uncharacterized protein LOC143031037 [Oratosquilla oratoria]|uniref:uncharacterized protein LOC143031037 n=1 Tax=Oratosquilla oratoria TaxID=337810 RepID=UPI003F76F46C